jgi:hypothetical protein
MVYKFDAVLYPERITVDHLKNFLAIYFNEKPEYFEIEHRGSNEDAMTDIFSIYYFTSTEYSSDELKVLQIGLTSFFDSDSVKLLLYNTRPSAEELKPSGKNYDLRSSGISKYETAAVILQGIFPMQNVAHHSMLTLVQSSKSSLLLNLKALHDDPEIMKHLKTTAVVGLRHRFNNSNEKIRLLSYEENDQRQVLYDGLEEMKDWVIRTKTCVKFRNLSRCGHRISEL